MDVTENNKTNIGNYLEFMISCSPQKNYKAISNSEKNLLKCLKKRARK